MLTIPEALEAVLARAGALPAGETAARECLGRALAEDVAADRDAPPFDKALVDGYAVRASDCRECAGRLSVGEEITAGRAPGRPLARGEAALVMTGAPLPEGADAVVMVERSRREGPLVVLDAPDVAPGQNRLPRGREMRAREVVLRSGEILTPARLGLLAAVGRTSARVVPRPAAAIVSTGDELVEPGQVPGPSQIRNSNAPMLAALSARDGCEATVLPTAPDELRPLRESLARGLGHDVLLISGGVSAGTRDLVPAALAELGVEKVFHKVRLKPGKPLWFGVGPARTEGRPGALVFGLPGNPVSGLVGFLLFVRPALRRLAAWPDVADPTVPAVLASPFRHRGERPTYHPSRRAEGGSVVPLDWAGSADLRNVASADGFAVFPAGDRDYPIGEPVRFLPMD
jgi:molybdopterin molybdotransferase